MVRAFHCWQSMGKKKPPRTTQHELAKPARQVAQLHSVAHIAVDVLVNVLNSMTQKRHTSPAQLAQKTAAQTTVHGSSNRICKLTLAMASRAARKPRKPRIPQNAERKHSMAHKLSPPYWASADVEPIFPSLRTSPANKCCVCKAENDVAVAA